MSRSYIRAIIQQAPQLKPFVYEKFAKSDERQRLRFGLAMKCAEADMFAKTFSIEMLWYAR
jgi:hypothetical protein